MNQEHGPGAVIHLARVLLFLRRNFHVA